MTKKTPSQSEEFAEKQDRLAALNPAQIHIGPSLIDIVAANGEPPESFLPLRIKHARTSLVLSVEGLSRLTKEYDPGGAGLSPTSISRYESGDALPGLREFRLIAEALEVPVTWLLYGSVDKPKTELSEAESLFVAALRTLIANAATDTQINNPIDAESLRMIARMEKLNRARKPVQKD